MESTQNNCNVTTIVFAVRVAWRFFGFLMAGAKWLGWAVKTVPTSPICTVGTQTKTNIPDFCWDFDWSSVPHETNPRVTSWIRWNFDEPWFFGTCFQLCPQWQLICNCWYVIIHEANPPGPSEPIIEYPFLLTVPVSFHVVILGWTTFKQSDMPLGQIAPAFARVDVCHLSRERKREKKERKTKPVVRTLKMGEGVNCGFISPI